MRRKQIAFDLDTKMLEKYYPTENWRKAYDDIRHHMAENGFSWIQGSVYISDKAMKSAEVTDILVDLISKNPWLNVCMRDCRETDIGRSHSKNTLFDRNAKVPTREERNNDEKKDRNKVNIKDRIKKKQAEVAQTHYNNKSRNKDKGLGD